MNDPFLRPDPDLSNIENLLKSLIERRKKDIYFFRYIFWISLIVGSISFIVLIFLSLDLYKEIGSLSIWSALGASISNQEVKTRQKELITALTLMNHDSYQIGPKEHKELIIELLKKDSGL